MNIDIKAKPKNRIYFKIIFIIILMILLMIPNGFITTMIWERSSLQSSAIHEISQTWGKEQSILGPVLMIPYEVKKITDDKVTITKHFMNILPSKIVASNVQNHQIRKRGIYEAILYNNTLSMNGNFEMPNFDEVFKDASKVLWEDAVVNLGISNSRSISSASAFEYGTSSSTFVPGILHSRMMGDGIHCPVGISEEAKAIPFNFEIDLKGSSRISFQPIAKNSTIHIESSWPSPSFYGATLPTERSVTKDGFAATWNTTQFNRTFPDHWSGDKYRLNEPQNEIGVKLINTVDHYQKNTRSVKYSLLIISLSFFVFFFFEYLMGNKIHPIQYGLVGLALVVFYLLLLSLSEHVGFNLAYWIAASATIGLIVFYASAILRQGKAIFILGSTLTFLYGYIFVILQLEDYALLAGSLGLFFILATIMVLSRKVDWYKISEG